MKDDLKLIAQYWPKQVVDDYMPYAMAWRDTYPGESPRTRDRHLRLFREWCKVANGKQLDPVLIIEWNEHISSTNRNGTTMARCQSAIRSFIGWLKGVGVIQMDPSLALAKFPQAQSKRMLIFTHAEYQAIVECGEQNPDRYAMATWLVVLSYHTGFALVDCCTLRWDEVNMDPSGPCYIEHVRVKMRSRTGSRAKCIVPIIVGGELWNWLVRLSKAHRDKSELVHPEAMAFYEDRRREPKRVFRQFFNDALGSHKSRKGRTFRCLRNTFCSRLLNAGVDPILVSKMTGHNNLNQLSVYVTPDIRVMQDAVQRGLDHVRVDQQVITISLAANTST